MMKSVEYLLQMSLCLLLFLASHFLSGECIDYSSSSSSSLPPLIPAMYVFGDSLFDSGNNNLLPTLARANYPPYGQDFEDGPTGRFTNGKTVADFIADSLRLPYPPPYVALFRKNSMMGYNYASGSCGILNETGHVIGMCLNLEKQIRLFESTVNTHMASNLKKSNQQLDQHLAKSLFIFSVGNNDYINNYFGMFSDASQRYNPNQFAQLLINELSQKLQKLYALGARKFVIFELGPIGCIPSIVKQFKPNGTCDEDINDIVSIFNDQLVGMQQTLTSTLQGSYFVLGQAHWLGYDAVINPTKYGLSDSRNPCCITWGNGTLTCVPELPPCTKPNEHYFWDGYHLTEATCSVIASHCISGSDVCHPMNIQELVLQ